MGSAGMAAMLVSAMILAGPGPDETRVRTRIKLHVSVQGPKPSEADLTLTEQKASGSNNILRSDGVFNRFDVGATDAAGHAKLSIAGELAVGTFPTAMTLPHVFALTFEYAQPHMVRRSTKGDCKITVTKADMTGVSGSFVCPRQDPPQGASAAQVATAALKGTFVSVK